VDRIIVPAIPVQAHVGVPEEERLERQDLLISLVLHLDLSVAGTSDDVKDTVDYDAACGVVQAIASERPFRLIESVAEAVARALLDGFAVHGVDVRVEKPQALRARGVPYAAVEIHRSRDA
jgi:dihydroneopterin aldolase